MYEVLDVPRMTKIKQPHTRRRSQPLKGYHSTILLKGGTDISLLPPDTLLVKNAEGLWEAHMTISNKLIVKKLAKALDAIAFL